ncbi:NAD(P)/FAD-dependent oxidoreductase [Martelella sp. FLE1502]
MTRDLCIIGGGPAGMAAASMAARHGLSVTLIDERPSAGGQIYRGLEDGPLKGGLGPDYAAGSSLIDRFRKADVDAHFGATLWRVDHGDNGGFASFISGGVSRRVTYKNLILATGAMERPVAFEGWTLPGVMGVGAAQLLLKSSAIAPNGKIVLAGNGPLLLLFANQLLDLGVKISAILDTAPRKNPAAVAAQHLPALFANRAKLAKGLAMQRAIRAAGIKVYRDVSALRALGKERVEAVAFAANGNSHDLPVDTLLTHEGVIPNTQLSRALNCAHVWDAGQNCLRPDVDRFGETSLAGVFVVGDGATINGAIAAPASVEIAVGRILERAGMLDDAGRATITAAHPVMKRERAFRPFLDTLYPPRIAAAPLSDATLVCRCEAVSAGTMRQAVRDGAAGPAQAKAFTRAGMGPCQGRVCGSIVTGLIAQERHTSPADVGAYHVRFPLKPVTIGEMAKSRDKDNQDEAHHAA